MTQHNPDFSVDQLAVEPDRPAHIARHGVAIDEVRQVLDGDYIVVTAKLGRHLVIGLTGEGRVLAIVLGARDQPGRYGLITARPAHQVERRLYNQSTEGRTDK